MKISDEINNRLKIIEEKRATVKDIAQKEALDRKLFKELGKKIARTQMGLKFFLLARDIYYKPCTDYRDNRSFSAESSLLARLNGEDYILRNVILEFINDTKTLKGEKYEEELQL